MMNNLSIDQLRSFVTIAETGSYTRAAERLFRTQPALSLQIKRLEDQLGTRLFQRNGRQTTVTESGQVLLDYAQRILDLNEEALAKLSVVETEGAVRVGVLEEVTMGPLVGLLAKFGRLCTKIQIELHVATSLDLAERIKANKLCLAVANGAFKTGHTVTLWHEPYAWVTHPAYDYYKRDPIPLVLYPREYPCSLRDEALAGLARQGRRWEVVFSSVSEAAVHAAVLAGLGVGMLPQSTLSSEMQVLGPQEGMPPIPSAEIALYRATEATSDAVDCLEDFLISHLRSFSSQSP
ncbi:MAG: LysR family transcriptional regulator [Rhodothermales bacterium]